MRKPLRIAAAVLAGALAGLANLPAVQAQRLTTYSFSQSNAPYEEFIPDSGVSNGGNNDDFSVTVPTKFPFRFNGQVYRQVHVSSNGFVKMGDNQADNRGGSWENTVTSSGRAMVTRANNNSAIGFSVDLISVTSSGNNVSIDWNLTAPIKYVAFQWKNYRRYFSGSSNDDINFQIRLYEGGAIEYHYGRVVADPGTDDVQIGLHGDDESAEQIAALDSWDSPTLQREAATFIAFGPSRGPASGTIFRFAPPPPTQNDLALANLRVNGGRYRGCPLSAQEPVFVTVSNLGMAAQTTAEVSYSVNGGQPMRQTVTFSPALANGQTRTVTFSGAQGIDLSTPGTRRLQAVVVLAGDTTQRNDTITTSSNVGAARPASIIPTALDIGQARRDGWRQASGNPITQDTSTVWQISFPFADESIGAFVNQNVTNTNDWFLMAGVETGGALGLRFQLAVTDQFSQAPISDIGTDSLKVMVTTTCISGWRQVAAFGQADLASGRISNVLQTFLIPISNAAEIISVGFLVKTGNGTRPIAYAFHLDNIQFVGSDDAQAVRLLGFAPNATTLVTYCPADRFPLRMVVRNNGQSRLNTLDIGYTYNGTHPEQATYTLGNGSVAGIAPNGGLDTVVINTPQTGLPIRGDVKLQVFTSLAGETSSSRLNDTLSLSFKIGTPGPLPQGHYSAYSRMITRGWITASNPYGLGDNQSGWSNGGPFINIPDTTAAVFFLSTGTNAKRDWLITPDYRHTGGSVWLRFNAAVTKSFEVGRVDSIGDDSLKIFSRQNCGTWQPLGAITQADVAAGLDVNLRRYDLELPVGAAPGEVQFAFVATNNSTPAIVTNGYRMHLNAVLIDDGLTATQAVVTTGLRLYPNPATDKLTIESTDGQTPLRAAAVLDMQGRVLLQVPLAGAKGQLSLAGLPTGLYIVRCQDVTGRVHVAKVQVQ